MAHELESMFYVGETPWHGLGKSVVDAPTTAAAIVLAGLDWRVRTEPLYLADGRKAPAQAVIRETDNEILGGVGPAYHPLQNIEGFDWFDPLVESGLVKLETAGSLRGGRRVWILARIDGGDIGIVKDDVIRKYVLLSNSHDGTLAVRLGFTPVRVVCANTLAMAHGEKESKLIRLSHRKGIVNSLEKLRDVMNLANETFEATAEQYRELARRQINADDLARYVIKVAGHGDKKFEDLSPITQGRVESMFERFVHGQGHDVVGVAGTWWAAYNAVTEEMAHNTRSSGDAKYQSLWFGDNARRNRMALATALEMAEVVG